MFHNDKRGQENYTRLEEKNKFIIHNDGENCFLAVAVFTIKTSQDDNSVCPISKGMDLG